MPREIHALILPLAFVACASRSPSATTSPTPTAAVAAAETIAAPRVVVLVRHGEKAGDDDDAALSEAGHARAACLADVVGDLGVTHIFHTPLQRTRDTAAPTAKRLGLVPTVIDPEDEPRWIAALDELPPGSVALVVGHSNTVPTLVDRLGAGVVAIDHAAFDWMFTVVLPERGDPLLLRTHYCRPAG